MRPEAEEMLDLQTEGLAPVFAPGPLCVLVQQSHFSEPCFSHQEKEDKSPRLPGACCCDLLQVSA